MNSLRTHLWRITLVASGVLLAVGGPMHPESDARDSLREELTTMTADELARATATNLHEEFATVVTTEDVLRALA